MSVGIKMKHINYQKKVAVFLGFTGRFLWYIEIISIIEFGLISSVTCMWSQFGIVVKGGRL